MKTKEDVNRELENMKNEFETIVNHLKKKKEITNTNSSDETNLKQLMEEKKKALKLQTKEIIEKEIAKIKKNELIINETIERTFKEKQDAFISQNISEKVPMSQREIDHFIVQTQDGLE